MPPSEILLHLHPSLLLKARGKEKSRDKRRFECSRFNTTSAKNALTVVRHPLHYGAKDKKNGSMHIYTPWSRHCL
jgi:hypothetical protein